MRSRLALLVACLPLLAACVTAPGDTSIGDAQLDRARMVEYETRRIVSLGPDILSAGRTAREGAVLKLTLPGGSVLRLEDGPGDCDGTAGCLHYLLAADLPARHAFLVLAAHYEGGDWLLIDDRSGRETKLGAVPLFSSDGQRFLVVQQDEAFGSFYGLEVWRRTRDGAVLESQHSLAGDAPEFSLLPKSSGLPPETFVKSAVWRNPNQIELDLWSPAHGAVPDMHWPALLVRAGIGWQLQTRWPRG